MKVYFEYAYNLDEEKKKQIQALQESYLSKYVTDFEVDADKVTPEIAHKIAETIPDAWERLLVDDKFTEDKALKTLRDNLLKQLPAPDTEMNTETFSQFQEMFEKKT